MCVCVCVCILIFFLFISRCFSTQLGGGKKILEQTFSVLFLPFYSLPSSFKLEKSALRVSTEL